MVPPRWTELEGMLPEGELKHTYSHQVTSNASLDLPSDYFLETSP